jgi:hypothetical protein
MDAISNSFKMLTKDVNELFDMLQQAREQEVQYYTEFKVYEAFAELDSRYDKFWLEANAVRDLHKQNSNWGQFGESIQSRLHPLALDYIQPAGKFCGNIPNVIAFCLIWPVVEEAEEKANKWLDFDYSEFSEIDFDPNVLFELREKMEFASNAMNALGDRLIEEWEPFGDYDGHDWKREFDQHSEVFQKTVAQIERYSNQARSLFRSLWEIKKQVQLSQGASKQNAGDDAIAKIEKLAVLLEKGLITQVEFDEKKTKLMEEI